MMRGPKVGHTIAGRYRIQKRIGRGGFGAVYIAHDRRLNREVALKCNLFGDVEGVAQFVVEARILAGLSHPALPAVYGRCGDYLIMEYVPGRSLEIMVERDGPLPVDTTLAIAHQIGEALVYLHESGVVHRDIKPPNILIRERNGRPVLVDFGLSKRGDAKTVNGARAVSPGYSPPEQYMQAGTDARSDVYALGATLYFLLTGKEPMESVERMMRDKLRPPHKRNDQVSRLLSDVVMKAMVLKPEHRYESVRAFLDALPAGEPEPTPDQVPTRLTPPSRPAPIQVSQTKKAVTAKTARPVTATATTTGRKKRKRRKRRPVDWGFWWMVVQAAIYYLGIGGLALLIMLYIALAMTGYEF